MESHILLDQPTGNDYTYEALFGGIEPIKKRMRVPKIEIYNQGADNITRMACGCYGLTHIVNAQDLIRTTVDKSKYTSLNPLIIWKEKILPINPVAESSGTTLQSNLDLFKKLGLITGYAKVVTRAEIEDALSHQRYIYTGSQTGDWSSVRESHIYKLRTDGRLVGHITSYYTFDNDYVYGVNSYGPTNGTFKVSWDLFLNNYYTKYSVSDTRDEVAFNKYRETYK